MCEGDVRCVRRMCGGKKCVRRVGVFGLGVRDGKWMSGVDWDCVWIVVVVYYGNGVCDVSV